VLIERILHIDRLRESNVVSYFYRDIDFMYMID